MLFDDIWYILYTYVYIIWFKTMFPSDRRQFCNYVDQKRYNILHVLQKDGSCCRLWWTWKVRSSSKYHQGIKLLYFTGSNHYWGFFHLRLNHITITWSYGIIPYLKNCIGNYLFKPFFLWIWLFAFVKLQV